jgi:hypothetical protein
LLTQKGAGIMELTSTQIKKYAKYSQPELKAKAKVIFHKFIRERDSENGCFTCCSCNKFQRIVGNNCHAGHYFSAGHNSAIEFDERNVNVQDLRCNNFLHGNLIEYQKFMLKKYGQSVLDELEMKRNMSFKPDRFYFIGIIIEYQEKVKKLSKC